MTTTSELARCNVKYLERERARLTAERAKAAKDVEYFLESGRPYGLNERRERLARLDEQLKQITTALENAVAASEDEEEDEEEDQEQEQEDVDDDDAEAQRILQLHRTHSTPREKQG